MSITVAVLLISVGASGGVIDIADTIGFSTDSPFEAGGPTPSLTTETLSPSNGRDINSTKVELLVVKYTNQERTERGLSRVEYTPRIAAPARNHAQTMAEHDFVGHTAPDGETAGERYREVCDYSSSGYTHGENAASAWYDREFRAWQTDDLVYLSDESDVARYLVTQWMRSDGHRKNILTEGWQEIGVGIAVRDDGKVFATQTFC